jgi:hypothetical protein
MHPIDLTRSNRCSRAARLLGGEDGGETLTVALAMGLVVATLFAVTGQFDATIMSFYRDVLGIGREIVTRLPV